MKEAIQMEALSMMLGASRLMDYAGYLCRKISSDRRSARRSLHARSTRHHAASSRRRRAADLI
jgi:hypothetical protein